jgi:ABC-type phosphate/phosphonate transport system substrate-binding protein
VLVAGDDQASIQALVRGEVRFAVVDGLAFAAATRHNPWLAHDDNPEALVVFKKWRPLPVPPIAVRKALSGEQTRTLISS